LGDCSDDAHRAATSVARRQSTGLEQVCGTVDGDRIHVDCRFILFRQAAPIRQIRAASRSISSSGGFE
jgi:hypothetical protein